ncbi:MAG: methylenetetrahydromethanopterin dehydrogenase, partial [Azospira oryzae]
MERPYILHIFTPTRHVSPFDVNMALDAGYNAVASYTDVMLDQVASLTQDAI